MSFAKRHKIKESDNISISCEKDKTQQMRTKYTCPDTSGNSFFCTSPWTTVYIRANGLVQACCFSSRILGDLREQELAEIWNGAEYRSYRKQIFEGVCPSECKICFQNALNSREVNIKPSSHTRNTRQVIGSVLSACRRLLTKA